MYAALMVVRRERARLDKATKLELAGRGAGNDADELAAPLVGADGVGLGQW